jgi:hypothetical protein
MTYQKVDLMVPTVHDYTIDTEGVVINTTLGKTLKGTKITKSNRYVKIILDKRYLLHRLVAEHFIPNPDNLPQVNHIDGDRYNNAARNLEWVSASNNVLHAYKTGLKTNAGKMNPISILTEDVVVDIWRLSKEGHKPAAIIRLLKLNVCRGTVSKVTNGKNWTHITNKL